MSADLYKPGKASHVPVMLESSLQSLAIEPDGLYVDCTFGRGGHSRAVLQQLSTDGRLIAFDKDPEAVAVARQLSAVDERFAVEHGSFSCLSSVLKQRGGAGQVAGVLMDLGVSSPQLDKAERGFSFMKNGPLDMRMDTRGGETAAEWLATVSEADMTQVLKQYGEERFARRIARAVINSREQAAIETTAQLSRIIEQAVPVREKHKHPATRTFQAIRIYLNRELEDLESGLKQAVDVLKPGGRLVVIAFHSLEDRIVKRLIRDEVRGGTVPKELPMAMPDRLPRLKKIGKAIVADAGETERNVRARSAVLRVAQRLT